MAYDQRDVLLSSEHSHSRPCIMPQLSLPVLCLQGCQPRTQPHTSTLRLAVHNLPALAGPRARYAHP